MIKKFQEYIRENTTYNPDKFYEYDWVVSKLDKGPKHIQRTKSQLKPEEVWVEETQKWTKITKITGQQWAFIFHPKF